MKQKIERRLTELRQELRNGQNVLADFDNRMQTVKSQLLRINGAIQVLEEILAAEQEKENVPPKPVAVGE